MLCMCDEPMLQVTWCVLCLPRKARHLRCGKEDAQDVYFGSLHGDSLHKCVWGYALQPFPWGEDLQYLSHSSSSSLADSCCSLPPAWPRPLGTSLHIQPDQSVPRQLPETFGPAGFKFRVLPLQASSSLLPALAFMPMSCLPSRGELAAEDASPRCWAHGYDA